MEKAIEAGGFRLNSLPSVCVCRLSHNGADKTHSEKQQKTQSHEADSMSHITCLDSAAVVSDFLNDIDYILTDCDGVLYVDKHAIPGTDQVIRKLRNMGKKVLFVTNNGTISRKTAHNKLNSMGFDAEFTDVFTTSFIVAQYLKMKEFRGTVSLVWQNVCINRISVQLVRFTC